MIQASAIFQNNKRQNNLRHKIGMTPVAMCLVSLSNTVSFIPAKPSFENKAIMINLYQTT